MPLTLLLQNEFLGTVFEDGEFEKNAQRGGPISDSITISQEKMLEMTADREFNFKLKSQPVSLPRSCQRFSC